jgi:hypothetical protein
MLFTLDSPHIRAAIIAESSKRWKQNDVVRICGGVAKEVVNIYPHIIKIAKLLNLGSYIQFIQMRLDASS